MNQIAGAWQAGGHRGGEARPGQPLWVPFAGGLEQQRGGMVAERTHLAGARAFEIPDSAGDPGIDLGLLTGDVRPQGGAVAALELHPKLAHLGHQRTRGGENLVIETIPPPGCVEERVNIRGRWHGPQLTWPAADFSAAIPRGP